jgi:hypothetical protein
VSSRHFGTNRYSLIIEITATPTKQTAGTRANRYNLPIRPGPWVSPWRAEAFRAKAAHKTSPHFLPGPKILITNPRLEIDAND